MSNVSKSPSFRALLFAALGLTFLYPPGGLGQIEFLGDSVSDSSSARKESGDMQRVNIDRPKPFYMLFERDARIHGLKPFQDLVDAAEPGATLVPPPGIYAGPVTINKPLTIEGGGLVTIDAGDKGTVMTLNANDSVIRGLRLTGSGGSHDTDDACLDVRGNRNVIEEVTADNCLFGIDLKQSSRSVLRNNRISSKPFDLGVRGDGLRLWYSNDNLIEGNEVVDSRDMVAWYSHRNIYRGNIGKRSRYSIHFMFADDNIVENNSFVNNAVGVYFMYTKGGVARGNLISHSTGATGMGIGFKEASGTVIENNEIIYCGVGVGSDLSPFEPDTTVEFIGNRFAYNGIGLMFNSETGGNNLAGNIFEGNLTDVSYGVRSDANPSKNLWEGNYWDTYQGFDANKDAIGDTPHEFYAWADQIWMEFPMATFFRASPVLELLNFLERLAPFSSPHLILRDDRPLFNKPLREGTS